MEVKIIGAGLAGVEAANYLANNGFKVKLYEMRPLKYTEAHKTGLFAELVCSNSFRSKDPLNAVGMLKEEMKLLNSIVMQAAEKNQVEAGSSLAVDRVLFSTEITNKIKNNPNIEIINKEVISLDINKPTIIATGPLVSSKFKSYLMNLFGADELNFYDAVAPIISEDSINKDICYLKSRYDKGKAAYYNCPMTKKEYTIFYNELVNAEEAALKDFEVGVFEGCMPVEVMAKRGFETLTYGPLKPVGLQKEDNKPYAVIQLRQDDAIKSMYNIVGFQTNLKFGEQKRIIRLIPGLENANILRYGVMHKNTYFNSPKILNNFFQSKEYPNLFIAGQISGVEGYIESASSGLAVGIYMKQFLTTNNIKALPQETIIGSLGNYISRTQTKFNPMNANLGLLPELQKHRKSERRSLYFERSIKFLNKYKEENL